MGHTWPRSNLYTQEGPATRFRRSFDPDSRPRRHLREVSYYADPQRTIEGSQLRIRVGQECKAFAVEMWSEALTLRRRRNANHQKDEGEAVNVCYY